MTHLTRVTLTCAVDRPTVWLRFGWPMHEDDPDGCHRHVYFRPGAVFARVERATPDRRQLSVLRAAGPGERVLRIAGTAPGAQLLLHATPTARTELALQAHAAIEAQRIAPDEVHDASSAVRHPRLVPGYAAPPHPAPP